MGKAIRQTKVKGKKKDKLPRKNSIVFIVSWQKNNGCGMWDVGGGGGGGGRVNPPPFVRFQRVLYCTGQFFL